jgi:hypothetical protein
MLAPSCFNPTFLAVMQWESFEENRALSHFLEVPGGAGRVHSRRFSASVRGPQAFLGGPQALQIAAQGSTRLLNKAQWLGVTSPCWPVGFQISLLESSLRLDGMRCFLLTGSDFAIPIQSLRYLWHAARSATSIRVSR